MVILLSSLFSIPIPIPIPNLIIIIIPIKITITITITTTITITITILQNVAGAKVHSVLISTFKYVNLNFITKLLIALKTLCTYSA